MQATEALQYIAQHAQGSITTAQVEQLLQNVNGTTFAGIVQVTDVAPAAAHKKAGVKITKVTSANVQLFNNLREFTNAYENAVKRSAAKLGQDAVAVAQFESSGNWFEHTDCYSIVKHKTQEKFYLFAIYNNAQSVYFVNGVVASEDYVAHHLTPAAAKELLDNSGIAHNKTHDLKHSVQVRVISIDNIVELRVQQQELVA